MDSRRLNAEAIGIEKLRESLAVVTLCGVMDAWIRGGRPQSLAAVNVGVALAKRWVPLHPSELAEALHALARSGCFRLVWELERSDLMGGLALRELNLAKMQAMGERIEAKGGVGW